MNGEHSCCVCQSVDNLVIISKSENEGLFAKLQSVICSSLIQTNEYPQLFMCIACSQTLSLVYGFKSQYERTCNKFRKPQRQRTKILLINSALEEDISEDLSEEKRINTSESIQNVWLKNCSDIDANTKSSFLAEKETWKATSVIRFQDDSCKSSKNKVGCEEIINGVNKNNNNDQIIDEISTGLKSKSKDSHEMNEFKDLPVLCNNKKYNLRGNRKRTNVSTNAVHDYHFNDKNSGEILNCKMILPEFMDENHRSLNKYQNYLRKSCRSTNVESPEDGVNIDEVVQMKCLKENVCVQTENESHDDSSSVCSRDEDNVALDTEKWQCEKCGKIFHPSNIKEHQMFHLLPEFFKCELCGKVYTRMDSLRKHLVLHSNPETFKCDDCTRTFTNPYQLKEHQMLHKNPNCFKCEVCGKSFTRRRILIEHQVRHSNPELFNCDKCARPFTTLGALRYHEESHLKESLDASKTQKEHSVDKPIVQRDQNYITCHDCNKRMHRRNFKQHEMIHRNPDSFKCGECGKLFSRKDTLKKHRLLHTNPDKFTCDVCGKIYTDPYHLKQHRKLHLNPDSFKCDICGKTFSKPGALMQHKLQHSNPDLFKCKKCGKTFRNIGSLKYHEQLHSKRGLKCS